MIPPFDAGVARAARERIDALTKPVGSLGRIESLAVQLCGIRGTLLAQPFERFAVLVGAADHGVAREGTSAYPPEVTPQMVGAFLAGHAAINAFARVAKARVVVADFGVAAQLSAHPALLLLSLGAGTRNFAREPAMDAADVGRALAAGARAVDSIVAAGAIDALALGDMGIGNTTSAAALTAAFCGCSVAETVGRGTGIDDERFARKRAIVERAISGLADAPWERVVATVGGFEIAGLAGAIVRAAQLRIAIVLDGYIVGAAALVARAVEPASIAYCIAAHRSAEPGHRIALATLGLEPLLDLDLRLGEGSGAALALPLLEAASRMFVEMQTFAEAGVATSDAVVRS